jgi:hypothetical protein
MLGIVALILIGAAVIAVAAVLLLRSAQGTEPREAQYPDREQEREVYEKLYGKRSRTVSAPLPTERPPEADSDSRRIRKPPADPR